jgi:Tfp pilus assembly PilM family ATPase
MILKPNALVYLRRNDLFIGGKHISAVKMKFDRDTVNNLEVINPEAFIATCQAFFSSHAMKAKRVLIGLDQSVVFAKTIDITDDNKDQLLTIVDNYVNAMPFEAGKRACLQVRKDAKLQLYATNADIYRALQEALRLSGIRKLIAITPAAAYSIDYTSKPSAVIDQFLDDKEVRRTADFSTNTPA